MRKLLPYLGALLFLTLSFGSSFAQRTCASHEHYEQMAASDPQFVINQQKLEELTRQFIASGGAEALPRQHSGAAVYRIPVVFHVVYNTATQNISDARILEQLKVMNDDFRKLNADANQTYPYTAAAADTEIEFCLAQRDPQGNATNGILRVFTTKTSFPLKAGGRQLNQDMKYSSQGGSNAWPRDSYLNFWVCDLGNSLLGFAQFPGGTAATDGVVCHFGSVGGPNAPGNFADYGRGRTATHEIGHWLNLRHIWGDGNCASDFVDDTPFHPSSNGGCPSSTLNTNCSQNPGVPMMWMNYMDYTYDRCMYMFTTGQKNRMFPVLGAGGARASLVNSLGCTPPGGGTICNIPGSLSSSGITETGANLSWGTVTGASGYTIQYRTPVGSGTWIQNNISTNTASISGLFAGTAYEWQVRTNCSGSSSAFSASVQFTTQQGSVTCNPPTGLSTSSVLINSATLSWTNSAQAISARLEYKTSAASTWTVLNTATSPYALAGLSASTTYNWRVLNNCGGATSSYANGPNFTTAANPVTCTDAYEPNNTSGTAAAIPLGQTILAKICATSDLDWYTFSNNNQNRAVRVTLGNSSGSGYNYNMRLIRPNGSVAGTTNGTNSTKVLTFTGNPTGAYRVEVFSSSGSSETAEYSLLAERGSSFRETDPGRLFISGAEIRSFPNPAKDELVIQFGQDWQGTKAEVVMTDISGRSVQRDVVNATGTVYLNVSQLQSGLYLMQVNNKVLNQVQKVMIRK